MAAEFRCERLGLVSEVLMSVLSAPLRYSAKCSAEAVGCGALLHHETSSLGLRPVVSEAQEVERCGAISTLVIIAVRLGAREAHKACLAFVECEAVLAESLRKHVQNAPCIALVREGDHEVVGIPNEECLPFESRLDLPVEPGVEHFVQVHVRKDRRDDSTLRVDEPPKPRVSKALRAG